MPDCEPSAGERVLRVSTKPEVDAMKRRVCEGRGVQVPSLERTARLIQAYNEATELRPVRAVAGPCVAVGGSQHQIRTKATISEIDEGGSVPLWSLVVRAVSLVLEFVGRVFRGFTRCRHCREFLFLDSERTGHYEGLCNSCFLKELTRRY